MVIETLPGGQGVLRGAEHHQVIAAPGQQFQIPVIDFAFDQTQIKIETQHPVDNGAGVGHLQLHPGAGLFRHVASHDAHRQVVADGQSGPHLELPQFLVGQQAGLQIPGLADQGLRPGPQLAAQFVQAQSLAGALEEFHLELGFQLLEGPGRGGLGHVQLGRRTAHVFKVGGGEEDFQLPKGIAHGDHPVYK